MVSGRPRFASHFTPSSTSLATAATTSRGLRRVCAWHSGWRDRALSPGGWTPSARICGWAGAAFLFGLMDGAGGASALWCRGRSRGSVECHPTVSLEIPEVARPLAPEPFWKRPPLPGFDVRGAARALQNGLQITEWSARIHQSFQCLAA